MRRALLRLLRHPVVRTLVFERLLLTGSAVLALAAVAMGRVSPAEVPGLLDWRLLSLFFVLTIAVELGKDSDVFDLLVVKITRRVKSARGLAFALVGVTAMLSALLTNDVALFLVVPFTMLLRKVGELDPTPLVVLEVLSANLLGSLTPVGNPQNLFLYARGGFTPGAFFAAQLPFVAIAAACLAAAVVLLVPRRPLTPPQAEPFDVDPLLAAGFAVLLATEAASLLGPLPFAVPLVLSLAGALLLKRRVFEADFSLVAVFAFLFVGVEGIERGLLYHALNPERIFGHQAGGLLLSGALLSQVVSNVPAALLLAPAAAGRHGFVGLLYGVNAGACGSPVGAIANLIGAQLFAREGGDARKFWKTFLAASGVILIALLLACLLLLTLETGP
jgi:Na+/H+ antiporter NhaD/arsenite permease-like protein